MQPKTFRKILDYLFRGRVPLSSIEDAWKVKVAGRTFKLKELEDLCTKFLQYRIDARNLIHFLKNTIKYDTPDLRDVVIARLLKDADKAFDNEQMLDLSEEELMNIMSRRPQVKARKVMNVLMKWAKKKLALEAPKIENTEESGDEAKKVEEVKDDDVEMKEEKAGDSKKEEKADDLKDGEAKTDDAKKEESTESKTDEDKKEDTKPEEKKDSEEEKKDDKKETDDKSEVVELDEKPEEKQSEQDLVLAIQHFIKYITWDYSDAEYYLKEVKGKLALSMEDENLAMTQMLESFVAHSILDQNSTGSISKAGSGNESVPVFCNVYYFWTNFRCIFKLYMEINHSETLRGS